jgi:hypothetical protein
LPLHQCTHPDHLHPTPPYLDTTCILIHVSSSFSSTSSRGSRWCVCVFVCVCVRVHSLHNDP